MSTIEMQKCTCAMCGKTAEYRIMMSTNAFGSMDLDTRPPEMERSTMHLWVQECPNCGYVAGEVSDETTVTPEYLKSEEYLTCSGLKIKSDLTRRFYRHYLINLHANRLDTAFYASLCAAWDCDDEGDTGMADLCRSNCIELIARINEAAVNPSLVVMKADMLRRMRRFDEVISEYDGMEFEDELFQRIVEFQVEKARNCDSAVYAIDDIWDDEDE